MIELTWAMIFKGSFCLFLFLWTFYAALKEDKIAGAFGQMTLILAIAALVHFAAFGN